VSEQRPFGWLTEEQRERLATIVARFIRVSAASRTGTNQEIAPETWAKAFDIALHLASAYESGSQKPAASLRANVTELAVEILEQARTLLDG
jgi:hypothetical protein